MSNKVPCFDAGCIECREIVTRAYRELRSRGSSDREAFLSAVRVLEIRHPGEDRNSYFLRVAQWLGTSSQT